MPSAKRRRSPATLNSGGINNNNQDAQQYEAFTLAQDAVQNMVTGGGIHTTPLVLRIANITKLDTTGTTCCNDNSYVKAVICDCIHSVEVYVLNKRLKDRFLLRDDCGSTSYVISVLGFVTSTANIKPECLLCLTGYDVLKIETRHIQMIPRRLHLAQQRVNAGGAGSFCHALFSEEQLSGYDAFLPLSPVEHVNGPPTQWSNYELKATEDTVTTFIKHHAAMKTLLGGSVATTTESAARNYMMAVDDFAQAQVALQKASLTTNSGRESADRAALVIQQHKAALDLALDHATAAKVGRHQRLTVDTLKEWHAILCGGGIDPQAGQLRTKNVRAGTADFLPPACLDQELQKFCNGIEALESRLLPAHPVTFAAAVLFGILDIHPFTDGNGRLARIAANWALTRGGLAFVVNLFATRSQREEYVHAIQLTRRNLSLVSRGNADEEELMDVTSRSGLLRPLVCLLLDQIKRAAQECDKVVKEKSLTALEEQEDKSARRFRERAAAGTCFICFDDSPNVSTLCCGKAVHLNCLAQWISSRASCPQCRADLPSLPPRVAAPVPTESNEEDGFTTEVDEAIEDTTSVHLDETMDDTSEVVSVPEEDGTTTWGIDDGATSEVQQPPARPAQCTYCRNRAAVDCSNASCGRCCVLYSQYQCYRHHS